MASAGLTVDRVTAWLIRLPLRRVFSTAAGPISERRVVLVRLEGQGHEGWGEAAPVPGHGDEDVDLLWVQLTARSEALGLSFLDGAPGMLGAAVDQAVTDLHARTMEQPLWRLLGSSGTVAASAAIGVGEDGNPVASQVESAAAEGYSYVKLKVTPNTQLHRVADLVANHPQLRFGADANGSLAPGADMLLHGLDGLGLTYIEQPGPAADLELHARLRCEMQTPLVLDESATSTHRIGQIVAGQAADIVNLKVGRFGTTATRRLAGDLVTEGFSARLGGLLETGIGRAHSVALGGHEFFAVVGDIAGSNRYFDNDLVHPSWTLKDGALAPPDAPGIGVEVDEAAVAAHAEESFTITR